MTRESHESALLHGKAVAIVPALAASLLVPMVGARAQSADPGRETVVTTCDALAAHGADRTRTAEGVADAAIVPAFALAACQVAVQDLPDSPRLQFQMGRALASAGRFPEAYQSYKSAADRGHVVAAAFAGDALLSGRGVTANPEMARRYYQKAAEGGFDAARVMLEAITFDPGLYLGPLLQGIHQGIAGLTDSVDMRRQSPLLGYVYSFVTTLRVECRGATTPANMLTLLRLRTHKDFIDNAATNPEVDVQGTAGEIDAQTFLQRHGCDGPVSTRVFENLNTYVGLHRAG